MPERLAEDCWGGKGRLRDGKGAFLRHWRDAEMKLRQAVPLQHRLTCLRFIEAPIELTQKDALSVPEPSLAPPPNSPIPP